jgi:hypothetical protein
MTIGVCGTWGHSSFAPDVCIRFFFLVAVRPLLFDAGRIPTGGCGLVAFDVPDLSIGALAGLLESDVRESFDGECEAGGFGVRFCEVTGWLPTRHGRRASRDCRTGDKPSYLPIFFFSVETNLGSMYREA